MEREEDTSSISFSSNGGADSPLAGEEKEAGGISLGGTDAGFWVLLA
jgi:hypothetical protein